MKTIITSTVSLLIGLSIGCFGAYRYYEKHISKEAMQRMVDGGESSDALIAATSIRAIGFIESGQTQKAVETLSRPIAHYYSTYPTSTFTSEEHLKLRATIDELARTNQTVAAQLPPRVSVR